jgi:hypothetical protein
MLSKIPHTARLQSRRSTYDRNRKGFDITIGRPQGEYINNYLTLKNRRDSYVSMSTDL